MRQVSSRLSHVLGSVKTAGIMVALYCHPALAQAPKSCDDLLKGPDTAAISETFAVIDDLPASNVTIPEQSNTNLRAQRTSKVQVLRSEHRLDGTAFTAGVWDGGLVLETHVEFDTRVVHDAKQKKRYSRHGTHVAGTIASAGRRVLTAPDGATLNSSEGMAPNAPVKSFDWVRDAEEMCEAADSTRGEVIAVSNHSYGVLTGWSAGQQMEVSPEARGCVRPNGLKIARPWYWYGQLGEAEDRRFGKYGLDAARIDAVVASRPNLSAFVSAGNHRNEDPSGDACWSGVFFVRSGASWIELTDAARLPGGDGQHGGYDTLSALSLAKNAITVGAIEDIDKEPSEIRPQDVRPTAFTSFGPTDSGRIKPDVVANGSALYSPTITEQDDGKEVGRISVVDSYASLSGTSMATPVATGIGVLLQELAGKTFSPPRLLRADEMKAVLVHTALSPTTCGGASCPNYRTGWGNILADKAGRLVAAATKPEQQAEHGTLVPIGRTKGSRSFTATAKGGSDIRVTMVWIDPAGDPVQGGVDELTSPLTIDLDMTLTDNQGGKTFFPWSLNGRSPADEAMRTKANAVDNVERIDIPAAESRAGSWTIEIKGPPDVAYALIVSGMTVDP